MKDIEVQVCRLGNGHGLHLPKMVLLDIGQIIMLTAVNRKYSPKMLRMKRAISKPRRNSKAFNTFRDEAFASFVL